MCKCIHTTVGKNIGNAIACTAFTVPMFLTGDVHVHYNVCPLLGNPSEQMVRFTVDCSLLAQQNSGLCKHDTLHTPNYLTDSLEYATCM